jgi:hypothetical protein
MAKQHDPQSDAEGRVDAGRTRLGQRGRDGSVAQFGELFGVAVDSASNVYVADRNNNTIRKVTPAGVVTTLAGLPHFGKDSTDGRKCRAV